MFDQAQQIEAAWSACRLTNANPPRTFFAAGFEAGHAAAWREGPPPERDDGTVILVTLKPSYTASEYYGEPIAVSCWSSKLKTTLHPTRINYEDVARWMEIPEARMP